MIVDKKQFILIIIVIIIVYFLFFGKVKENMTPASKNMNDDMDLRAKKPIPEKALCRTNDDCNVVFGDGQNTCDNNKCVCKVGAGTFCQERPRYYKPVAEMTPQQIIQYKMRGKIEKMTLADYRDWLSLWEYDLTNLPDQHKANFTRMKLGEPIYEVPLEDPVAVYLSANAAKRDKVCLDIPNAEVDSPLNWKIHPSNNTAGNMNSKGEFEGNLNFTSYKNPPTDGDKQTVKRYERTPNITVRDWFLNNVNWMFNDIEPSSGYKNPNINRFLNIVQNNDRSTEPTMTSQPLVIPNAPKIKTPQNAEENEQETPAPTSYMQ
jgi:hypothetical protein